MTTQLTTAQTFELEKMIDASSLAEVVSTLVQIAREKADHIRANWQDERTACTWDQDAHILDRSILKITN